MRDPRARGYLERLENSKVKAIISRGKTVLQQSKKRMAVNIYKNPFLAKKTVIESNPFQEVYDALVLGVKDYVRKNGFKSTVIRRKLRKPRVRTL